MIEIYEKEGGQLVYCGSGAEPVKFQDEKGGFKPEVGQTITYRYWPSKQPGMDPEIWDGTVLEVRWVVEGEPTTAIVIVARRTGLADTEKDES